MPPGRVPVEVNVVDPLLDPSITRSRRRLTEASHSGALAFAISAALPKPTIAGTSSVPARRPFS